MKRGKQRLQQYIDGIVPSGPELVHIDLTNACNLDCVTCWNYSPHLDVPKSGVWKRQHLDYDRFLELVDDLGTMGVERVILSGSGEPFFHPRIYDVLEELQRRALHVSIITNGTVVDWARLVALGVKRILLNTSAATAASYVAFHPNQRESTWDRLLDGVRLIHNHVQVNQVQVICGTNWHEIPQMIDLAAEVGAARVSYKLANLTGGTEAVAIDETQRLRLVEELIPEALARAQKLGVRHNLDVFGSQLRGEETTSFPIDEIGCHAGYFYSRVYVDGRVFYCCEHIETGRLDERPFREIWHSEQYNQLRVRLAEGRFFPGCFRCGKYELNFKVWEKLNRLGASGAPRPVAHDRLRVVS